MLLNPYRFGGGSPPSAQGWNPADKDADITLSGANLVATLVSTGSQIGSVRSVTGHGITGDWYAEITLGGGDEIVLMGVGTMSATLSNWPGADEDGWSYFSQAGKFNSGFGDSYGSAASAGDVIGIRLNAGALIFTKNGSSMGTAFTLASNTYYLMWGGTSDAGTRVATLNTGQSAFANLPSGASAWG